ncbi:hypothetical protein [Calothrix sp. CCY 0018]|uniref:hypothetical protein n=1 Tax=Calothrix sp. CCY 0018 TaxID=3103864 RepID=UPI0039C5AEE1
MWSLNYGSNTYDLTAEERQVRLKKASREYMHGKITRFEFQKAERQYGTDYSSVTLGLARKQGLLVRLNKIWELISLKSKQSN